MNRCYIIGGGPSIAETNLSLLRDKFVIGVNMAYKLGNWLIFGFFVIAIFINTIKKLSKNGLIGLCLVLERPKEIKR